MKILISGGCKNGKSSLAQKLAKGQQNGNPLYYIATMQPCDSEDNERISRHIKERDGWGFTTIEQYTDIHRCLNHCDPFGSFLLDSTTALLANEMFGQNKIITDAYQKTTCDLLTLCNRTNNIVFVSDHLYKDAIFYDPLSESYKKGLAAIDRSLAATCDIVIETAYTIPVIYKGKEAWSALYEKIR